MTEKQPAPDAALLKEALALHQGGRLIEARHAYETLLARAPRSADALHLLGVVHRQQGDPARAAALIGQALDIDPNMATAHCNLGAALQDLGRGADALAAYDAALRLHPAYALALANRGNALRKLGRLEEAVDSYDRALALKPAYPEAACNRAIALLDLGRVDAALAGSEAALAARPRYPEALCVRANALFALRRFDAALAGYDAAVALDPQGAEAHAGRALALHRLERQAEALAACETALALRPGHWRNARLRADILLALGRRGDAIDAYRMAQEQAVAAGADASAIAYALAALGAASAPAQAPRQYVKELFDSYAGHFERHLVDVLGYRTPELLGEAVRRHVGAGEARTLAAAVDLGCGTGLCGPILRPLARRLAGVDLSDRMLARAAALGVYDELACADIGDFLAGRPLAYDLVVAADVLVYFGDLSTLFAQVRAALRPAGWFAFSTELLATGDFALQASSRYAHGIGYLEGLAAAHGFAIVEAQRAAVRREHDAPVEGNLMVLRAPS